MNIFRKYRGFIKKSFIFILFLLLLTTVAVKKNNSVLSGFAIITAAAQGDQKPDSAVKQAIQSSARLLARTAKMIAKAENERPMPDLAAKLVAQSSAKLLAQTAEMIAKAKPATIPEKNMIVGYYGAWTAYSGFTPDKINASKLTHINYAFANIGDDLTIQMGYPDIDSENLKKLNNLKKINAKLKILISVGGWTWSGKFSDAALTDASRTKFANSCVDLVVKYNLDGVDIDWEYPVTGGLSGNKQRAEDKRNFTVLIQKIREKLDERGKRDGKKYILSIAGGSGYSYVNNVELKNLSNYIDYANIMTYDIHAVWDKHTDFCSPLYTNINSPDIKWSVSSSADLWISAGFPAEKIVIGVPFYGYRYDNVKNLNNGLYQSHSGGAALSYDKIASSYLNNSSYKYYYDTTSKVPWLFNGSTFISYDDANSIRIKGEYIRSKPFAGAAIWELSQDSKGVLLDSLYKSLQK